MKKTILVYMLWACHLTLSMEYNKPYWLSSVYEELNTLRKEVNLLNHLFKEHQATFNQRLVRSILLGGTSSLMLLGSGGYFLIRNTKQRYDYYTRHKISEVLKKYGIIFCQLTQTQKDAITILVTQSPHHFHTYAKKCTKKQKLELCQWQFFAALTEIYFSKPPKKRDLSRFYKRTGLRTHS